MMLLISKIKVVDYSLYENISNDANLRKKFRTMPYQKDLSI